MVEMIADGFFFGAGVALAFILVEALLLMFTVLGE